MTSSAQNVLRNFTRHQQGPREIELARAAGFALSSEPEGLAIPPGAPLEPYALRLAALLRDASRSGHAVLIGGLTALWIAAVLAAPRADLPRLFFFEMEEGVFTRLSEIVLPPI